MLYIQDRTGETVAIVSDYYNDMHKMYTQSGTGSYDFTVSRLDKGQEFIIEGNYVVMLDDEGKAHQFTIMKVTETETEKVVECEDASLQLLNKQRRAWIKPATAQPITYYANKALQGTGWEIGYNEVPNLNRTLEWTGSDSSLNRLFSIATQFDNAELDFHVELDRTRVIKRVVDIKKKLGSERDDIQLVYGDTVTGIQKTVSILNFRTALYGVGALVENTKENEPEKHYDFSAIEYDDGDFFSPKGDSMLYARKANERFNLGKEYIDEDYSFDTKDANELLKHTLTHLKEVSEPEINYEVELADFDGLHLTRGDTVRIIDHGYNPELLITARVIELDKSYTDPSQDKAIFGNFMSLVSGIDPMLLKIQQQLRQLPKARTPYPWVRYADDDKGTGMSALPAGKSYMATVWNYETAVPSDNPIDYAEKWVLIKGTDGEDGSNGTPGKPGTDGKTPYFHIAYADSADGTDGFYVGGGRNLLMSSSEFDRFWSFPSQATIVDGYDGHKAIHVDATTWTSGLADVQQPIYNADVQLIEPGEWYTISFYAKGTGAIRTHMYPSVVDASAGSYVDGVFYESATPDGAHDWTLTDEYVRHSWSFKAKTPLSPTTNAGKMMFRTMAGNSTYTSLPKLEKGTTATPWSPAPSEAHPIYMGTYTDFTQADSLDPTAYLWSQIKGADGEDGVAGKDGLGIKSTAIAYQLSSSGTVTPTGTWSTTVPTLVKGQYLWTRTDWTYTDGTAETGYSVSYVAKDGNNGTDGVAGKDGVGIKTTTITYASSTSGTTAPTSGWTANPPATSAGHYIWTKTVWEYTDSTGEIGYSVGKIGDVGPKGDTGDRGLQGLQGPQGSQGIQGPKGTDGKSSYTHIAYANMEFLCIENSNFTLSRVSLVRYGSDSRWVYKWFQAGTYTAETALWGQGDPAEGTVKHAELLSNFSTSDSASKTHIGMYVDFEATDSTDITKYNWTLVKGEDGASGIPGKAGADGRTPYFHIAYADSADGKDGFYVGGGQNLLRNSRGKFQPNTSIIDNIVIMYPTSSVYMTQGQQYTLHADASSGLVWSGAHNPNTESNNVVLWLTDSIEISQIVSDTNTGNGTTFTWNNPSGTYYLRVNTYKPDNSGYVENVMLEEGTVAHPWAPAPSEAHPIYMGTYTDFTQADSLDPTAYTWSLIKGADGKDGVDGKDGEPGSKDVPVTTVSAAQPTTAKNGDIWWVLNSKDVATAMKVYTSGAWVDKKVDQSVLNIVTLNAVTINGSTINGSEFNISYTGTLSDGRQGSSQQVLDKHGYSQTSTIPGWGGSPIVTRSEIDNTGGIVMGFSNQSEYNPSQPWANTLGSISIDPVNLYIGFTAKGLSGDYHLDVQDAYQNSGSATYLNGWGSWNADYSLKVVRKGRMVTVWGYIKHNNSATITPFAQVPAWARPQQGLLISAVTFNSSVGNPIASALVMNAETGKIGFNSGGQKGGYVCFSTTYVGSDI